MGSAGAVMLASTYLDAKRPEDALRVISPFLGATPDDVAGLMVASRAFLAIGDPDEALRLAERAGRIDPDNDQVWRVHAIILVRLKRWAEARESAAVAQRLAPSLWRTHLALAEVDHAEGVVTEAGRRAAAESMRLAPGEPDAHVAVGNSARISRDFPAATAAYQRALRIQPEHVNARNNLALVAMQRGNLGSAARDFLSLLAMDPTSAVGNLNVRIAMRTAVTQALGLVFLVVTFELYTLGIWGLAPSVVADPSTLRFAAACAFGLAVVVAGWRLYRLRRTSGDRFVQLIRTMRNTDTRSIVYAWIGIGVLAALLAACFTPQIVSVALCGACWVALITVLVGSRQDLTRQRAEYASRGRGPGPASGRGRARRALVTVAVVSVATLAIGAATVSLATSSSAPPVIVAAPTESASAVPGGGSSLGDLPSAVASCEAMAGVLGELEQTDFTATMKDPTADIQKSRSVVAGASAELNRALSQVTNGTVSMEVSSVMEALSAETTALNRYSADPSIGTDDIFEGQYETQFALMQLADSCIDLGNTNTSGVQTASEACEVLSKQTARADLVNRLREAKGNPAKTIGAINVYANDLEGGLGKVTNPAILAVARASDGDIRSAAKTLKAAEDDPSIGQQTVVDAVKLVESSAEALVEACTPSSSTTSSGSTTSSSTTS